MGCVDVLDSATMGAPVSERKHPPPWLFGIVGIPYGGGVVATVALFMLGHDAPGWTISLVWGLMMIAPALAILMVDEPARERRSARDVFSDMWRSVREVLFSRAGLTGIALCLSPVGT